MTPEEIRIALREGTIDPFDLVAREGSSVRRELVEVDELFNTGQPEQGRSLAGGDAALPVGDGFIPMLADATHASVRSGDFVLGQGHLELAGNNQRTQPTQSPGEAAARPARPVQKRRDPKHFHVIDGRGRVLGPMSAGEIQSLYFKGVLGRGVYVTRSGSSARVPVGRFVEAYARARGRKAGAAGQGAHPIMPVARPAGRLTFQQFLMAHQLPRVGGMGWSPMLVFVLVLALAFGGLAAWLYKSGHGAHLAHLAEHGVTGLTHHRSHKRARKLRPAPRHRSGTPRRGAAKESGAGPLPRANSGTPARQSTTPADTQRDRASRQRLEQQRRIAAKAADARRAAAERQRLMERQRQAEQRRRLAKQRRAQQQRHTQQQLAARRLPSRAAVQPSAAVGRQPTAAAALHDGQVISHLGPMHFDKSAVARCTGSCSVTFSGPAGSVQGVFFKSAWGQKLLAKPRGVYLSGLVRGSGGATKILISNVQ